MTDRAVVVYGSANVDLTVHTDRAPGAGETVLGHGFTQGNGGKGANQAMAAVRMGASTRFVGCIGDDALGQRLAGGLTDAGVDTSRVVRVRGMPTGVALIVVDGAADNRIVVAPGANAALDGHDTAGLAAALAGAAVLLLQLEVPMAGVLAAAREARRRGVIVVLDPAPVPPAGVPDALLALTSIVTPNEHESALLAGTDDVTAALGALRRRGTETAIVTLGANGARWSGPDGDGAAPAPPVTALDTTGAGDAFNGALATALAEGHDLSTAIGWALAAGALAVTRPGAQDAMPARADVLALVGS